VSDPTKPRDVANALCVADLTALRGRLRRRLVEVSQEVRELRREVKRLDGEIDKASEVYEFGQVGLFVEDPPAPVAVEAEAPSSGGETGEAPGGADRAGDWGEELVAEVERRAGGVDAPADIRRPFVVPVDRPVVEVLDGVASGRYVGVGPRGSVGPPEVYELHRSGGELYGLTAGAADKRRRGVGDGGDGVAIGRLRGWRFEPA